MFKADNWIASGSGYVDTCQRKRFLCHWEINRDSWLHLAKECSVSKELNFADDLFGSEVPPLHFGDYIKYLCCKASGSVTAWLNSLPLYLSFSLLPYTFFSVQWSQREPDAGGSKESFQRSCGDQEPVSGTLAILCLHVCMVSVHDRVYVHAHLSLVFHCACKCAQPPCACASIFHCVKCQVPPAFCIDWHRCSLAAVCVWVWVCAMDVMSVAFLLFSLFVLPQ